MPRLFRRLLAPLAGACALLGAAAAAATPAPPVPVVDWRPCAEDSEAGFECASAVAPLDHDTPRDGRTVTLQLIRHRAEGPAARLGTVFFNPGGPGGAGTEELPALIEQFPPGVRRRFDVVSWDPRGVGTSTHVQCFATDQDGIDFFAGVPFPYPVSTRERAQWMSAYTAFGTQCRSRNAELMAHSSTADTARDMDLLREALGEPKMNYIGISYGTILGATYVNMFPDRVRTAVLDGNISPSAWTNDGDPDAGRTTTGYRIGSHLGTAATFDRFLTLCATAGPDDCAFAGRNARETRRKWRELLVRARQAPIPLDGFELGYAGVVQTTSNLLITVGDVGGFPGWTTLGEVLQALYEGGVPDPPAPPSYAAPEAQAAVECGDSPNPTTPWRYPAVASQAFREAPDFGPVIVWGDSPCVNWGVTQEHTYAGPWDRWTARPVLVIGNTFDPSTPYLNAVRMAQELRRGHLLTVEGYGHTEMLNPSDCASRRIEDYLIDRRLPRRGLVCPQTVRPFQDAS